MSESELNEALARLGNAWWEEEQRRRAELKTCPDNGRKGTWVMEDDRHRVEVEAESALEAWEQAEPKHSWWDWSVYFLGCHS